MRKRIIKLVVLSGAVAILLLTLKSSQQPETAPTTNPANRQHIRNIAKDINNQCLLKDANCYEGKVRSQLLDRYQTPEILAAIYDFDTYFSCHAFTHFIGRALYQKLGTIPDAYSQIDFTCHGGTYHGVIEAYLDQNKTTVDEFSGDQLLGICADSKTKTDKNENQVFTECLHGFGHAFMFVTNNNLPQALTFCDRLNLETREKCYGGALMENSTSSTNPDHPTQWLKPEDKFYPCTILAEQYLNQCYFYQANYLLMATGRDYQRVFADCGEVAGGRKHDHCILGLGAQLASVSNEQGIDVAASVCQIGKGDDAHLCIQGAVPSLMARYGGESDKIVNFCHQVATSLKELCFVKLGMTARSWWQQSEVINKICQKAEGYEQACLGNSKVSPKY